MDQPLSYCKSMLSDIRKRKTQQSSTTENDKPQSDDKDILLSLYEEKCIEIIKDVEKQDGTTSAVSKSLQKITQLVLDLTFIDECDIIDRDFKVSDPWHRLISIIDELSGLEKLVSVTVPGIQITEVLGPDLLECIQWRRGALLYMYCHTIINSEGYNNLPEHVLTCLETGIRYLVAMLSVHGTPVWLRHDKKEKKNSDDDDDGSQLIAKGIWSDNHLLATMYCGEMCFWYTQLKAHLGHSITKRSQNTQATNVPSETINLEEKTQTVTLSEGQKVSGSVDGNDVSKVEGKIASLHIESQAFPNITELKIDDPKLSSNGNNEQSLNCNRAQSDPSLHSNDVPSGKENVSSNSSPAPTLTPFGPSPVSDFGELYVGKQCMVNFIWASKGPMSLGGWSTDRAEFIEQYFDSLTV